MTLIDMQQVAWLERNQHAAQINGSPDARAGGGGDVAVHLVGQDACEGGLAQAA
jgi:hypothetical protein